MNASLLATTPSNPLLGAAGVNVTASATPLWTWPGQFGVVQGIQSGGTLVADNSTTSGELVVPPATIISGGADVRSSSSELSGDYSISVQIDNTDVLNRSGAAGYLPFSDLSWAMSDGQMVGSAQATASNGSNLFAIIGANGTIDIYAQTVGLPGSLVYSHAMVSGTPPSSISSGNLSAQGPPCFEATDWRSAFVFTEEATGAFNSTMIPLEAYGTPAPAVGSSLVLYDSGKPAIVVPTAGGIVYIANWSAPSSNNGWPDSFSQLANLGQTITAFAAVQSSQSMETLAFASASSVDIFSLNASGFFPVGETSLPTAARVSSLALSGAPETIWIGGSNGDLYEASSPGWSPAAVPQISSATAITGVWADKTAGETRVVTVNRTNTVNVLVGLGLPSPSQFSIDGPVQTPQADSPMVAPIEGNHEPDVVVGLGANLWVAQYEGAFNSTHISSLGRAVQDAETLGVTSTDSAGNPTISEPIQLTVHGGAANLADVSVEYNFTRSVDLTQIAIAELGADPNGSRSLALEVGAKNAGQIHLEVRLVYQSPSPPTPESRIRGFLIMYGVWLAGILLVSGGTFVTLGLFRFYARSHTRIPAPHSSGGRQKG